MSRVAGLVLAAGAASRFGGVKLLAALDGKPLLQHVLDVAAESELEPVVVVLGRAALDIESAIRWRGEHRLVNPQPERGLASSLHIGMAAVEHSEPPVDGVVVLLGDQPRVRVDVIRHLVAAGSQAPIVVPRYERGGGSNPALLGRTAWALVASADGDRGMGPIIAAHPELVGEIAVDGDNPDVDTTADLRALTRSTDIAATPDPAA